jgi:Subtilase family
MAKLRVAQQQLLDGTGSRANKSPDLTSEQMKNTHDRAAAADAAKFAKFALDGEASATAAAKHFQIAPEYETPGGKIVRITGKTATGLPTFQTTTSLASNTLNGTDQVWGNYSISGNGRTVGLFDFERPLNTHQDLLGRITGGAGLGTAGSHATAMAGLLGSIGVTADLSDTTQGAAFGSNILSNLGDTGQFTVMNGFALDQMRVHSHSYTSTSGWSGVVFPSANYAFLGWLSDIRVSMLEPMGFGRYTVESSNADGVVRNRPYTLPVWAAGNERGENAGNQGFAAQLVANGVNQGTGWFYTFRSPSAGAQAVAGFFNGTTFWPIPTTSGSSVIYSQNPPAQISLSAAAPIVPVTIAGGIVPPADGGAAGFDSLPDGFPITKNTLVVGALDGTVNPSVLAPFSACGPTDDGRIKPDLLESGVNVLVPTAVSNSAFAYQTGTSAATPQAAGSVSLWAELQEQLWTAKHPYVASTYKALAIHTAVEKGTVGPDYQCGWGCFSAIEGATLIESNFINGFQRLFIKEVDLLAGVDASFTVKAVGGAPIKVTAVWSDPNTATLPGDVLDPNNPMVVNNLDVEVYKLNSPSTSAPNGTRYHMWRLNPASPSTAATRLLADQNATTKDRNNVEQVTMPSSAVANSWYRVIVKTKAGTPFMGDANGKQRVSIVLTGVKEKIVGSEFIFGVIYQSYVIVSGQVCATLAWNSIAGETYRIEFANDPYNGPWVDAMAGVKVLANSDASAATTVPLVNLGSSGFFRIATVAPNPFNLP